MRREHIHVPERHISQARNRTPIMHQFAHFVPASAHHLKPRARHRPQLARMGIQPGIHGSIPLHGPVKSQQILSHRTGLSIFQIYANRPDTISTLPQVTKLLT